MYAVDTTLLTNLTAKCYSSCSVCLLLTPGLNYCIIAFHLQLDEKQKTYKADVKIFSQRMFNSSSGKDDNNPKSEVRERCFCISAISCSHVIISLLLEN
jgi:hypothetical protein